MARLVCMRVRVYALQSSKFSTCTTMLNEKKYDTSCVIRGIDVDKADRYRWGNAALDRENEESPMRAMSNQ